MQITRQEKYAIMPNHIVGLRAQLVRVQTHQNVQVLWVQHRRLTLVNVAISNVVWEIFVMTSMIVRKTQMTPIFHLVDVWHRLFQNVTTLATSVMAKQEL